MVVRNAASRYEDELEEGSDWEAAKPWMLGLMEVERTLFAEWDERANIPRDSKRIWLCASAESEEDDRDAFPQSGDLRGPLNP